MFSSLPTPRRVAFSAAVALVVGLAAIRVLAGPGGPWELQLLESVSVFAVGALLVGGVVVLVMIRLAGWRDPESEEEFDAIVERAERLAAEGSWGDSEDDEDAFDDDDDLFDPWREEDFKALVRSAIDELPLEFHRALEHVAVVISDGGRRRRAYGLYEGDTVARDNFPDRIVIFRDTLLRDFGHDPELLRAQVTRTVRHELAHHLGWDERGVQGLGL
jgi:predicted Zn-dependent protease with MMP-like domain